MQSQDMSLSTESWKVCIHETLSKELTEIKEFTKILDRSLKCT